MQGLTLIGSNKNPVVIVISETNSFGEQLLTFVHEDINGKRKGYKDAFPEGEWIKWDRITLLKHYQILVVEDLKNALSDRL